MFYTTNRGASLQSRVHLTPTSKLAKALAATIYPPTPVPPRRAPGLIGPPVDNAIKVTQPLHIGSRRPP
jgi:hypothetical protein